MNHQNNTKIIDPFLQEILRIRRSDTEIADILRSVQADQNAVIDYDFSKNLIVQGCAGSGKTMILFHRLANMLYNLPPDISPSKISVIIPNTEFKKSVDRLVYSLGLEKIRVQTMDDYLLDRVQHALECIFGSEKSDSMQAKGRKGKNNDIVRQIEQIRHELNRQSIVVSATERLDISSDVLEAVQSIIDDFRLRHKQAVIERQQKIEAGMLDSEEQKLALKQIRRMRQKAIKDFFGVLTPDGINRSKVVAFLTNFNKYLVGSDQILMIDEGQDYSEEEYKALLKMNEGCIFNVFGDINQKIFPRGLNEWDQLQTLFDAEYFTFNQDYRNSVQIVDYINHAFDKQIISVGFSTKDIEYINQEQLPVYLEYETQLLKHRSVIITEHPQLFSHLPVESKTVAMTKGIEYDTVFIAPDIQNLPENMQYVALTRALSDLYIIN